ncbi:MAG: TraR/DksA C4-type zinc finger protein [Kiritimatiellaeota bacterium]|nr:TraR/DksA C4-type zinc finger protein [Kiritimatiellota bacterium]
MAKTNTKKPSPVQKKNVKGVVAKKPPKALAVKQAKPLPKKAAAAKPAPAKRPAAKKAAPARKAAAAPAKKPAMAKKPAAAPPKKAAAAVSRPAAAKPPAKRAPRKPVFSKADLKQFQIELLALRDRITNQSGSMRSAALQRSDEVNLEEDGTDAFMRLQTLGQVGTQQSIVTKIDEALHDISKSTYGICETCGELISKARLSVLPFARNCITCQSEMERADRHGRFR